MADQEHKIDSLTAVIGELAKRMQKKYGDEALDVFVPILKEYGFHAGTRLAKKMADRDFPDRVAGWLEPLIKSGLSEVVEHDPTHVTIRGRACPLNLEGTNRALCDACMAIDQGLVSALAENEISLRIEQSMARGDNACVVHFSV
ncbi:MAG: hypothetical protein A2045_10100 [Rhodocyclales bacterium GWA2_65_20]|nr:MAG: hypothetical protein A2045_10100 [Rhodocyclales bacterium GWA2_65_20]